MTFPGFDHFYALRSSGSARSFIADIDLDGRDPVAATRGTEPVRRARARWAMGEPRPGLVVWTRLVGPVLVHESLVHALHDEGVTGWSTYPVDLDGKRGEPIAGYVGLVVTGRCGAPRTERSERATHTYPGGVFPVQRGLYFDERSWDGADMFMPAETAWILVSERARAALSTRRSALRFEKLLDVEQIPVET